LNLDYRFLLVFLVLRDSQDDCCHLYPDPSALLEPAASAFAGRIF